MQRWVKRQNRTNFISLRIAEGVDYTLYEAGFSRSFFASNNITKKYVDIYLDSEKKNIAFEFTKNSGYKIKRNGSVNITSLVNQNSFLKEAIFETKRYQPRLLKEGYQELWLLDLDCIYTIDLN